MRTCRVVGIGSNLDEHSEYVHVCGKLTLLCNFKSGQTGCDSLFKKIRLFSEGKAYVDALCLI